MPKDPPQPATSSTPANKTFRVSLWIIATVAIAQVAAIAFVVVRNDLGNRDLASPRPTGPGQFGLVNSTRVPAGFPEIDTMFDSRGWEPVTAPPEIEPTIPPTEITDPMVRDTVELARLTRQKGDVQTALEQFRSANKLQPDTPEILYEIASSCTTLDLNDEASDAWMEIRNLGESRGGEFYKLAEIALLGSREDGAAPRKMISLSNYHVHKHPQETRGEMRTLRTSIKARDDAEIYPDSVQLRVLFFDLVNGRQIARGLHDGEYPRRAVTLPLDWEDTPREEIMDIAYFRDYADEIPGEQRQYHGFVAYLYYDNELQDILADPRTLSEEIRMSDALQPPPAPDNGSRVDNSLFPQP